MRAVPKMQGASFHSTVSCREIKVLPCTGEKPIGKVALLDLGVKTRTVRILQSKLDVYLFPADSTFEDICAHGVDGVFYSNGPGIQNLHGTGRPSASGVARRNSLYGYLLWKPAFGFGTWL